MSEEVLSERAGAHTLIVKLNRPAARHAINAAVTRSLAAVVRESNDDANIRAVILTANGGDVFCAGADLKEIAAGRGSELVDEHFGFAGFVRAPRRKPWIAAVAGKAFGGGLELSLACDMIVAGRSASFGLPEVLRGLYAGAGGVFRLPRVIPRAIALEMIASGVPIDAQRAYGIGLVNRIVDDGAVLEASLELAEKIALAAPIAVVESLAIARSAQDSDEASLWSESRAMGERLQATEDYWEGPKAFAEKRAPQWKGR